MKKTLYTLLLLGFMQANAQVVINEYSASNVAQHTDNFGQFSDWFELYNPTAGPIDLSGYHLSDNPAKPTKYVIPGGVIINNGAFLKVYCNGMDQFTAGNVHTNFKLTQCKPESIVLADPSGAIIEQVTLVPTQPNHSRGRTSDGAPTWSLFKVPTQGASNSLQTPYSNYNSKPSFSSPPGAYSGTPLNIALTAEAGSTIYYTTNGSTPTTASTVYTAPIFVGATTVIRAFSVNSDTMKPPSFIETNTYFFNENHTIHLVSVSGDQIQTLLNGTMITPATTAEYFDVNGVFQTEVSGTANEHGNDSWAYNQRGFDYIANDEFGINYAYTHKIFKRKDRDEFDRLIFKPAANDNYSFQPGGAHIRDAYVATLSHDADLSLDERTYEPCVLYVNGQYWGVYEIREKVDDKDFTDYYYKQNEPYIYFLKTWGATWEEYGSPNALADWNNLRAFVNANSLSIPANYDSLDNWLNTQSLIDYFILNTYTNCADWLNWNTAWWRGTDPNGDKKKWRYTLWDMDATFGHYVNYTGITDQGPGNDPCDPSNLGDVGGQGHVPLLDSCFLSAEFRDKYVNRFIDLNNTYLSCDYMVSLLDSLINVIKPEMPRQIARWGGGSYAGWMANVTTMKNYLIARCDSITDGLMSCYNLGGPYTINFMTDPPGVATITVNDVVLQPSDMTFSGTYYSGITTDLETEPINLDYEFDYWEIVNVPNPSSDSMKISTEFTTSQTVVAHYIIPTTVFVPSAFSPNADGVNDYLMVYGKGISKVNFDVFNRWGERVFSSEDKDLGWDGKYKNQNAMAGVYAYRVYVEYVDGKSEIKKGNVTLVR